MSLGIRHLSMTMLTMFLHHWLKLYKEVLDKHAPQKKKKIRSDQLPWISPAIMREISRRNRLYKNQKKNPTLQSWETYKVQRNKVTALKRKGMKAFCRDASINARHHGEFWKKMSPFLPNSSGGKKSNGIVLIRNQSVLRKHSTTILWRWPAAAEMTKQLKSLTTTQA